MVHENDRYEEKQKLKPKREENGVSLRLVDEDDAWAWLMKREENRNMLMTHGHVLDQRGAGHVASLRACLKNQKHGIGTDISVKKMIFMLINLWQSEHCKISAALFSSDEYRSISFFSYRCPVGTD